MRSSERYDYSPTVHFIHTNVIFQVVLAKVREIKAEEEKQKTIQDATDKTK